MTYQATYTDEGVVLTICGKDEGLSVLIKDTMLASAMERHVRELSEWLGED